MAEAILFIGWGAVIPGRERQAIEVMGQVAQYHDRLRRDGEIGSFETCLIEPHGGDLAGFSILRGDRDKLNRLRYNPEFLHNVNRAELVVQNLGVVMGFVGEELTRVLSDYQSQIGELAP